MIISEFKKAVIAMHKLEQRDTQSTLCGFNPKNNEHIFIAFHVFVASNWERSNVDNGNDETQTDDSHIECI